MGLALDTDTELFLMLDLSINERQACEHTHHNEDTDAHDGDAEWYMRFRCPACHRTFQLKAFCNMWKTCVMGGIKLECFPEDGGCGEVAPGNEWVLVCERMK